MAPPAKTIVLTGAERQRLTDWARAGTAPQLARRARVILGSAAGLGSRRLAQQERMSRTVQRWLPALQQPDVTGCKIVHAAVRRLD